MTDQELAEKLAEAFCNGQRRWRKRPRGVLGALTTIPIPEGLIREAAPEFVPVVHALVEVALQKLIREGIPEGAIIPTRLGA